MGVRRFVVLGATTNSSGKRMVILPDDSVVWVAADCTDAELVERFDVDSVVHAPRVVVWRGLYVDGPLAGQHAYVDVNEIGASSGFRLSEVEGGRRGSYVVTQTAEGEQPAQLHFVGFVEAD